MSSKTLLIGGEPVNFLVLERSAAHIALELEGTVFHFTLASQEGALMTLREQQPPRNHRIVVEAQAGTLKRIIGEGFDVIAEPQSASGQGKKPKAKHAPRAPMPGVVVKLLVAVGDQVDEGAPLAVMEAMKMQLTIEAPYAGRVTAVHVKAGDKVAEGTELVALKAEEGDAEQAA